MADSRLAEIALRFVVETGVAPAAALAVSWPGPRGANFAEGGAFSERSAAPRAGSQAFFDLASVSKPFLALTVARLAERGRLRLSTPLGDLLPEARGTLTGDAPLSALLAHRAGLEAHRALFAPLAQTRPMERSAAIREATSARRPECASPRPEHGYAPLYSDLGYVLVGVALEALEQLPLDRLLEREVCAPLGLEVGSARVLRRRHVDFYERCLPTETVPFRGGEVRGIVHDENAWALSGHGLSGHAGLFGTGLAVCRFGRALLDVLHGRLPSFLDAQSLESLLAERPGGTLRAGFDGKSVDQSSVGDRAGPRTFGHLGFTGTSLWCDPDADRVLVMLTNRVCPTRSNTRIRTARPLVNDALFAYSGGTTAKVL